MRYQPLPDSEEDGRNEEESQSRGRRDPDSTQGCSELLCSWILIVLASLLVIITFPITGWFVLKLVPKYERFVVFRLGRVIGSKGPGIILLLPFVDQWQKVDLRPKTVTTALFEAASKDGAEIVMDAEIQYQIWNPVLSVAVMGDLDSTIAFTVQNSLVYVLQKKSLAKIETDKSKIEQQIVPEVNRKTRHWGLEVRQIDLVMHKVTKQPEEVLQVVPPSGSRLNKLPAPFRKLAAQILHSKSPQQLDQSSARSTDSEESSQTSFGETSEQSENDHANPDWILSKVNAFLSEDLVKQIGACYLFTVNQKNGTQNLYYLDLSSGSGLAGYGMPKRDADVTLEVSEDTMQALFSGYLKPFSAYMSGRIRVQGDLKLAMRLEDLIKKLNP